MMSIGKKKKNGIKKTDWRVFILLIPGLLFVAIFTFYPIVKMLVMSFFDWKIGYQQVSKFVGLANYKTVLTDQIARRALMNTVAYAAVTVPLQMIFGLFVAVLINGIKKFSVSFRLAYYLPVITSWVVVALLFRYILSNENFYKYFTNTLFVAFMTIFIAAIISSMLAYSFARFKFPGKNILYSMIISVMLIPGLAMIIPQFEMAVKFKLVNNLWGVILFYSAWVTPFSTFLLKGYIEDNIPKELDEAIYIDGGNIFTVYRHVMIPMASPAIAAVSILNFLFPFEELGWSQTILKSDGIRTLPVAITMFFQAHNRTDWGYVFAMTCLSMIPVIVFYLLLQKYFISGLSSGSIKG